MALTHDDSTGTANSRPTPSQPAAYRITLQGIDGSGRALGIGMRFVAKGDGTKMFRVVVDQSGLRGLLNQLWDLNATLIEAVWEPDGAAAEGDV